MYNVQRTVENRLQEPMLSSATLKPKDISGNDPERLALITVQQNRKVCSSVDF